MIAETQKPLLSVQRLRKYFPVRSKGFSRRIVGYVRAVDDISFDVSRGRTLGLVGESGCGKTTAARTILRALEPTGGKVLFRADDEAEIDLAQVSHARLKPLRRKMQMIFQDPFSSLNPRMTVGDIVSEPLVIHKLASGGKLTDRVAEVLRKVGLKPEHATRYPHAFSGGQRQRIGIARALIMNPSLVVADEPVSALDVSVQAQVINLLEDLQEEFNLTYIFIAHDLSVVKHIADEVAVMYAGRIVEHAPTGRLFQAPAHPYTRALLSAVPSPDPEKRMSFDLYGEAADPGNLPGGCSFHPRCPHARDRCRRETPELRQIEPGRCASCHFAEEIAGRRE